MSKSAKNPGDGAPSFAAMANPKVPEPSGHSDHLLGPQGYLDVEQINNPQATQMGLVSEPFRMEHAEPIPMPTPDLGMTAPMSNGWEAPRTKYKKDADPLLVRALELFERLVAGGLLNPYASSAHTEVHELAEAIRKKVAVAS